MAFQMVALMRSSVVLMVAVIFMVTQLNSQSVFAARFPDDVEDVAPAPAPFGPIAGHAPGVLLPSLAAPALLSLLTFLALKHL